MIAIALSPGTLKTGFINLFRNFPKICIKFVLHNNSVAIKKGKSVGKTEFDHKNNPFLAASKLEAEKRIRLKVKIKNKTVKKYFRIEITINRILPSIIFLYMQVKYKIEQKNERFLSLSFFPMFEENFYCNIPKTRIPKFSR